MSGAASVIREKDPRFVAAGRKAMRARWGPRRILRLDELSEPIRAAIEAMVAAEANAQAREVADDAT